MIVVPTPNKIICKVLLDKKQTETGLYVPEQAKGRNYSQRGQIIAIGRNVTVPININDIVIYRPGIGEWTFDTYRLDRDSPDEIYVIIDQKYLLGKEAQCEYIPLNNNVLCSPFKEKELTLNNILIKTSESNKKMPTRMYLSEGASIYVLGEILNFIVYNYIIYTNFFYTYIEKEKKYFFVPKEDILFIKAEMKQSLCRQ